MCCSCFSTSLPSSAAKATSSLQENIGCSDLAADSVDLASFSMICNCRKFREKKSALPCGICKGKGFYSCKLCKGNSTIHWSPLYDPVYINPCLCPTCDGNKVQRCLNCLGKGYN